MLGNWANRHLKRMCGGQAPALFWSSAGLIGDPEASCRLLAQPDVQSGGRGKTESGSRAAVFDWLIRLLLYAPVRRDNPFGKRPAIVIIRLSWIGLASLILSVQTNKNAITTPLRCNRWPTHLAISKRFVCTPYICLMWPYSLAVLPRDLALLAKQIGHLLTPLSVPSRPYLWPLTLTCN